MGPPITYEADGTQYVAFAGGLGRAAAIVGPTNEKVDNAPMLFVFALGGTEKLPEPPPPAPPPSGQPAAPAGAAPEPRN